MGKMHPPPPPYLAQRPHDTLWSMTAYKMYLGVLSRNVTSICKQFNTYHDESPITREMCMFVLLISPYQIQIVSHYHE